MAADKLTDELVDFFYRDLPRAASLYAQLFGGHLTSVEKSTSGKHVAENVAGGAFYAKYDRRWGDESTESRKETYSPGDILATDVLKKLIKDGRVAEKVESAPTGCVVRAIGSLRLIDGGLMQMAANAIATIPEMGLLAALMKSIQIPAAYILKTSTGTIAGTLDVNGLHEPIGSTYIKHGSGEITGVEVIGIKEMSLPEEVIPDSTPPGLKAILGFATSIRQTILPADAYRVAPIAIFRVLT